MACIRLVAVAFNALLEELSVLPRKDGKLPAALSPEAGTKMLHLWAQARGAGWLDRMHKWHAFKRLLVTDFGALEKVESLAAGNLSASLSELPGSRFHPGLASPKPISIQVNH